MQDGQSVKKETAHDAIQVPCIELQTSAAKGNAAPKTNSKAIHYFVTMKTRKIF